MQQDTFLLRDGSVFAFFFSSQLFNKQAHIGDLFVKHFNSRVPDPLNNKSITGNLSDNMKYV